MGEISRSRLVVILGVMAGFGPLSFDLYLPALPRVAHDLDASASLTQWTMSACMVGLAIGQLLLGPLSDRRGRRGPLLCGAAAFSALSLLIAVAPSVEVVIILRLLQGLAGSVGIVVSRAMIRDRFEGRELARAYSHLTLVTSTVPILAPLAGGQLLRFLDWRGVFVVLALLGATLAAISLTLPETLPLERRRSGGLRALTAGLRDVVTERQFVLGTCVAAAAGAATFTYISLSSIILQDGYGLTAQAFSLVFAVNGVGVVTCGYANSRLVARSTPRGLLLMGASVQCAAGGVCLVAGLSHVGLMVILPCLFVFVAFNAFSNTNAFSLAMSAHGQHAGTAAALAGTAPFLVGALVAPFAGLAGVSIVPLAVVVVTAYALSGVIVGLGLRHPRGRPVGAGRPSVDDNTTDVDGEVPSVRIPLQPRTGASSAADTRRADA